MATNPIVILGGGISGLSCAYYLYKFAGSLISPRKIVILESRKQLGGWLETYRGGDGTVRELGPRSIRAVGLQGFNTLALADEIGLADEVIGVPYNSPPAYKRFIYVNKKLHELPSKPIHLISKVSPFKGRLYTYVLKDLRTPKTDLSKFGGDISVHDFIERRLGEEFANYFFNPMCRGIAAGDSKRLSMQSTFPEIFKGEQTNGSVLKAMFSSSKKDVSQFVNTSALASFAAKKHWSFWNLTTGLQRLPEKMCEYMMNIENSPIEIYNESTVNHIDFDEQTKRATIKLSTPNEDLTLETDYLFSALPSRSLANALSQSKYPTLCQTLNDISCVNVAVVCLEYKGNVMPNHTGFGFLVPGFEDSKIMGVSFDSKVFPNFDGGNDITGITVMIGGNDFEKHFGNVDTAKESEILSAAVDEARVSLNIKDEPFRYKVWLHKNAIPQYYVGHKKKLKTIDEEIKKNNLNIILLGSSYQGLSINDCIYNSRNTCEAFAKSLSAN